MLRRHAKANKWHVWAIFRLTASIQHDLAEWDGTLSAGFGLPLEPFEGQLMKLPVVAAATLIAFSTIAIAQGGGGAGAGAAGGAGSASGSGAGSAGGTSPGVAPSGAPPSGRATHSETNGSSTAVPTNTDAAKSNTNTGTTAVPTARGAGAPYQGLPGVNADGSAAPPAAVRNAIPENAPR
jgi:hypothetical protein